MSVVLTNNAVSKLASSLSSGATALSVTVGEGSRFPSPTAGNWFPLSLVKASGAIEIVRCTARSGDVFTVTRAQESTSAQSFSAGDRVELRLTAAVLTETFAAQQTAIAIIQTEVDGVEASVAAFVSAFVGFRNKLINGKGMINQRAYASGTATAAANQYTLDRWRVPSGGQNLTFATSGNGRQMTAPAGGVEQVIEGENIEGGVYTLSWTGTATATVNGTAITSGGQTASLTAGADVTVRFIGGTFEKPQFEVGSQVTAFEQRAIGLELLLCKRYFYRLAADDAVAAGFFRVNLANAEWVVRFPARMRVAPTVSFASVNALFAYHGGGVMTSTSNTVISASVDTVWVNSGFASTSTTYMATMVVCTGQFINFSAEL